MPYTLDSYAATVVVKEALLQLTNVVVLPQLLHRDYEKEVGYKGKTINITIPPRFTANNFGAAGQISVQEPESTGTSLTLNNHWDVSFELRDLERTVTDKNLLAELVAPAAIALGEQLERSIMQDFANAVTAPASIMNAGDNYLDADRIADGYTRLFNNLAPVNDGRNMHFIMSGNNQNALLKQEKFTNSNFTGESGQAIREALLGRRFGFNLYAHQLTPGPTPPDATGAVNFASGYAIGATTMVVDGFTGIVPVGAIFTVGAGATLYTVVSTAQTTGNTTSITFAPGLTAAAADDAAIAVLNVTQNLAFHRNAFALAMRALEPPVGGAGVVSAVENYKGYTLRSIVGYDQNRKRHIVSLDALWGNKLLYQELAVKYLTKK